jgi:hypothetical protein
MIRFDALAVAASISSLHGMACAARKHEIQRGEGVPATKSMLDRSSRALTIVAQLGISDGLRRSAATARQAKSFINADKDVSSLKAHLMTVVNVLLNEIRDHIFLRVPDFRRACIDNEQLFGQAVYEAFPSARADIRDAGNCLAADCNTAAVFHMMRAVEWGLRALCVDLGYQRLRCKNKLTNKVTYKPLEYSDWEGIVGQVKSRVHEKLGRLKRGRQKQALQEF